MKKNRHTTGRVASNAPSLQNIPVRSELGRTLRKYMRDRRVPVDTDFDFIENRITTHAKDEPK